MSLFHKVIGVVIALLGFLACNDEGQQNAVKDEGFYKTTQSFSRMMSKLEKNHGIKSTDPTLRHNIRKSIEYDIDVINRIEDYKKNCKIFNLPLQIGKEIKIRKK